MTMGQTRSYPSSGALRHLLDDEGFSQVDNVEHCTLTPERGRCRSRSREYPWALSHVVLTATV